MAAKNIVDLPPLPELEIHGASKLSTSQEVIDNALRAIYEKSPETIQLMVERERIDGDLSSLDSHLTKAIRECTGITSSLVQPSVIDELRRRIAIMYNLPRR